MTRILMTYLVALAGAATFLYAGLPLPWLLGTLAACLVTALAGLPLRAEPRVTASMRTILGVAVGTSVTPALFHALPHMLASLALMPVFVITIGCIGYPFFRRVFGFDPPTAYYSAMPGGLQDMLVFGEEAGGDVRALSLIHATRVLIVVTLLPVIFSTSLGVDLVPAAGGACLVDPAARDGADGAGRARRLVGGGARRPLRRVDPRAAVRRCRLEPVGPDHPPAAGGGDPGGAIFPRHRDRREICRDHLARASDRRRGGGCLHAGRPGDRGGVRRGRGRLGAGAGGRGAAHLLAGRAGRDGDPGDRRRRRRGDGGGAPRACGSWS